MSEAQIQPDAAASAPDYLVAAAALFNTFTFDRLIPLVSLLLMAAMFIWVLFQAQRGADFDASEFLRDERGRLSAGRLFAFVCCMAHTWVIFSRTISDKITLHEQVLYAVTWSGSMVLLQGIEAWKGGRQQFPPNPPIPPEAEVPK